MQLFRDLQRWQRKDLATSSEMYTSFTRARWLQYEHAGKQVRDKRTWVVCTVEMRPVCVSHLFRLPSVSPMMTKCPHAAIAVATPSDELDMSPHEGRLGFVSVTCSRSGRSAQKDA